MRRHRSDLVEGRTVRLAGDGRGQRADGHGEGL